MNQNRKRVFTGDNFGSNPTSSNLETVLTNGNNNGNIAITSLDSSAIIDLQDEYIALNADNGSTITQVQLDPSQDILIYWNGIKTGQIQIDNISTTLLHDDLIQIVTPNIKLNSLTASSVLTLDASNIVTPVIGATGTFISADAKTVTVTNGIITSIV